MKFSKKKGEEEFRKIERELYKRFSTPKKKIIATGGGVIKNPANIANLKKGGVISIILNLLRKRLLKILNLTTQDLYFK